MSIPSPLTGKQRRHLRALAHSLNPVVQVGKHGLTESVEAELGAALLAHELIKVRVGSEAPEDVKVVGAAAAAATEAHLVQTIGSIAVLYRQHPDKPKLELPRGK